MQLFLQRLFDGVTIGILYATVAVALVLIFKATTLVNFAQGEMAMFGTFLAYVLAIEQGLPLWLSVVIAMIISAAAGTGIERVLIRPFDPSNHLPIILVTLGLFLILNAIAGEIWDYTPREFPSLFPSGPDDFISIGGARLFYEDLGTWVVLGTMIGALFLLLNKTRVGLAFRAVSSNAESAPLVGIRTGRTLMLGWALASAFGTLGGTLVAPRLFLQPNMMGSILIFALAAAALGGLDSLGGAAVGGLLMGLISSLGVGYLGGIEAFEWIRSLQLPVAFTIILVVLWVKPSGIWGTTRVERV